MARRKTTRPQNTRCNGCNRYFTEVGYQNHLRQTTSARCQAEYERGLESEQISSPPDSEDVRMSSSDHPDSPRHLSPIRDDDLDPALEPAASPGYEGSDLDPALEPDAVPGHGGAAPLDDDIPPMFFDEPDEPFVAPDDPSDDEDEPMIDDSEEEGIEPDVEQDERYSPVPNFPAANPQGQGHADIIEQDTPPGSPLLTESDITTGRKKNEESLRQPVTVVKYPDQSAGSPVNNPTHLSNSMKDYGSNFAQSENNPYAPFANKRNWDIARWAKLRGPSSNALTELLGIEGVSNKSLFP